MAQAQMYTSAYKLLKVVLSVQANLLRLRHQSQGYYYDLFIVPTGRYRLPDSNKMVISAQGILK